MSSIDVEAVDRVEDDDSDASTGPADIPVEATDSIDLPAGIDAPNYVLYGGKGGVGKTTMSAATALASAAGGVSTLVVSTDPAHSLSDTLETDIPPTPKQIRDDMPLYAAEIDPEAAMDEGMFGQGGEPLGGLGQMGEMMGDDDGPGLLGGTMPGADEAAAMRQLLEYLDDPRFERVVVDTAPTGHTLRLLQLPEMLDSMVGRMMKLRERFGGMVEGVKGMFGGSDADIEEGMQGLDDLQERIVRLRSILQDPSKTDFRVVMVPEEMSVVESERLVKRLNEFEIPVQTLVVNRVMENLADVVTAEVETEGSADGSETVDSDASGSATTETDASDSDDAASSVVIDPEWIVSPNLESCEFCQRRWQVQQKALAQAMELFRGRDVKRVPLLAEEVQGEAALRVVAACLE